MADRERKTGPTRRRSNVEIVIRYGFAVVVFLFLLFLLINVLRRYPRQKK